MISRTCSTVCLPPGALVPAAGPPVGLVVVLDAAAALSAAALSAAAFSSAAFLAAALAAAASGPGFDGVAPADAPPSFLISARRASIPSAIRVSSASDIGGHSGFEISMARSYPARQSPVKRVRRSIFTGARRQPLLTTHTEGRVPCRLRRAWRASCLHRRECAA